VNYIDFVRFRALVAEVLGVDEPTVERMLTGETVERILVAPARATPSEPEAELAHRSAALASAIIAERPLSEESATVAIAAVSEFVRMNGHDLGSMEGAAEEELAALLEQAHSSSAVAQWISSRIDISARGESDA
jgi:DNA-binding transcriptional regulator YdaS (Cro superfamily)